MRIVISGGTGFIGSRLCDKLIEHGHKPVILTRSRPRVNQAAEAAEYVYWNPESPDELPSIVDGSDAVVNLAGESIGERRWSESQKNKIRASRINATKALVSAIEHAQRKPGVMVSASAIGIYDHKTEGEYDEESETGNDFLASVCHDWEAEARKAEAFGVRLVIVRFGIVLGKEGGALKQMVLPFKFFAGGPIGSGNQWMQWIHIDDAVNIVYFALTNSHVRGVLNATSPNPVTNKDFSKTLGKLLRRPSFLPVPPLALKVALGSELADALLLHGQKVLPRRTMEMGYKFKYPDLEDALRDVM